MANTEELEHEVTALLKRYVAAFATCTRDDLQAFCRMPLACVTGDGVALCDRYPFDPVEFRQTTGFSRSNLMIDVVHVDAHKAHVLIDGTRCRADGSVVEHVGSVHLLTKQDGEWRICLLSEFRTTPNGDDAASR